MSPSSPLEASSSFPISSPTFWDEAARALPAEGDMSVADQEAAAREARVLSKPKRARAVAFDIADDDDVGTSPSSRPAKAEADDASPALNRSRRFSPDTTLSYLPNRLDLTSMPDAHAYLASAEYAPNSFGDIGDYMRKKEIKVQTQNRDIAMSDPAAANLPQIFRDQSFYINGNTHPPMEELRKMILQRGGEVRPVLRNKGMVKFIIAPMLTQMKFKQFQNYRVVREGWITESCKAGKLLDWTRWKLVTVGGWEEGSRKGLEGFFKGAQGTQGTQADTQAITTSQVKAEGETVREETGDPGVEGLESGSALRPAEATANAGSVSSSRRPEPRASSSKAVSPPQTPAKFHTKPSSPRGGSTALDAAPDPGAARPGTASSPSQTPRASKQSLLQPLQSSRPVTPAIQSPRREVLAPRPPVPDPVTKEESPTSKPKRSEGVWEFYHSKESNEDAQRLMRDREWRLKNTAERGNEGGFIDGYYQNSRLHHLSTWKAELRVLVAAAQRQSEEASLSRPGPTSLISPLSLSASTLPAKAQPTGSAGEKVIFHVDFDCFFVSCGLATRSHLKGKPAVVCHSTGGRMEGSTSEIASASYEAREKGVKNGMSLGRARTLVGEDLQTIPYEFETYKKFSLAFYTVLMGYADELQAVSVDEALIDVTSAVAARESVPEEAAAMDDGDVDLDGAERPPGKIRDAAVEIAEKIRDEIRAQTSCEVSIGISHNIFLSKLATRRAKPAGVYHLLPAELPAFLAPLSVEDFPSVGYSIRAKIEEKFNTCIAGELMDVSKGAFRALLGPKTGDMVWGYLRGLDERRLEPHKERKSISAEMNYGIRFQNDEQAEICVRDLAAEVAKRMKSVNAKGRLLTLKLLKRHPEAPIEPPKFLGHGWCESFNKSAPIGTKGNAATDDPAILSIEAVKLLRALALDPTELRGVGIQITKLDGEREGREAGQGVLSFAGMMRNRGKMEVGEAGVKEEQEGEGGDAKQETEALGMDGTREAEAERIDDTSGIKPPDAPLKSISGTNSPPEEHGGDPSNSRSRSRSPSRSRSRTPTDAVYGMEEARDQMRNASNEPPAAARSNATAGPSRLDPGSISTSRPALAPSASSDGIDPDFLAALPEDLRREVKRDHARTRAQSKAANKPGAGGAADSKTSVKPETTSMSKARSTTVRDAAVTLKPGPQPVPVPSRLMQTRAWANRPTRDRSKDAPSLNAASASGIGNGNGSARAAAGGKHATAHITKQLRPKNKTHLRAGQIADLALYSAWNRTREGEGGGTEDGGGTEGVVVDVDEDVEPVLPRAELGPRSAKGKEKQRGDADGRKGAMLGDVDDALSDVAVVETNRADDSDDVEIIEVPADHRPGDGEADPAAKIGLYFIRDLRELDIDPTVFAELPGEMQREVVEEGRRALRQRKMLHRPADTFRLRAKERQAGKDLVTGRARAGIRDGSRTASVSPSRLASRANAADERGGRGGSVTAAIPVPRFAVVRAHARRPALYKASTLPDVLDTLTRWIESTSAGKKQQGPAAKDAAKVEGYLVKLVSSSEGAGMGGVEMATECLKWMRVILEEKWPEEQVVLGMGCRKGGPVSRSAGEEGGVEKVGNSGVDGQGAAWWNTYGRFWNAVSAQCEAVFGAPLRL